MPEFTAVIIIRGDECDYDPVSRIARIMCSNCAHYNEIEVDVEDGVPRFQGFMCENCGTWNGPQD